MIRCAVNSPEGGNMSSKDDVLSPLGKYEEGMAWNPVEKVIIERRSIRLLKKNRYRTA
jgi:hypothetical protein